MVTRRPTASRLVLLVVALLASASVVVACFSPGAARGVGVVATVAMLVLATRIASALTYLHLMRGHRKATALARARVEEERVRSRAMLHQGE